MHWGFFEMGAIGFGLFSLLCLFVFVTLVIIETLTRLVMGFWDSMTELFRRA